MDKKEDKKANDKDEAKGGEDGEGGEEAMEE